MQLQAHLAAVTTQPFMWRV